MRSFMLPLAVVVLSGSAPASDFTVPSGFNLESAVSAGPVVAQLADGRVLVSTGVFGADALGVLQPDGTALPFATGFGSLAGVAQSPVTGDIVVGDSLLRPALSVLRDLNGDGDMLDGGEVVPYDVQPGVLPNGLAPLPFALSFEPGTDVLYMSGSTPFSGMAATLGVVSRFAGGTETVFADGLGFAGSMAWDDGVLHVADLDATTFVGRVLALADGNADGDATDAGEAVEFASGLSGASGLVRASDGSFYVSGLFDTAGDFSGCIGRLAPDTDGDGVSDGLVEAYFDGFVFADGLTLLEGPGGFTPGVAGDGRLYVGDFTFPAGNRIIRTAPHATTSVVGTIANNATFDVVVGGDPGATAFSIVSLDTSGATLSGIGDVCTGFGGAFLVLPPQVLGASGQAKRTIRVVDQPQLVGMSVAIQGVVFQAGAYGLGDPIVAVIAP